MSLRPRFSFLAKQQTKPKTTEQGKQPQPSIQASSLYPFYSSSGNKIKANTTFDKPATRIRTSVISDIRSAIRSRKEPTISPTPKFLTVSARNFFFPISPFYKEARTAKKRDWRSRIGLSVLLFYILALTFLSVHLLEENRKLRKELQAWEGLNYHVAPPKKPRFYHRRR